MCTALLHLTAVRRGVHARVPKGFVGGFLIGLTQKGKQHVLGMRFLFFSHGFYVSGGMPCLDRSNHRGTTSTV